MVYGPERKVRGFFYARKYRRHWVGWGRKQMLLCNEGDMPNDPLNKTHL